MRKHFLIGFLVAGLCLYWVSRGISLADVLNTLRRADLRWIGAALGVYISGYLLRARRWEILIQFIKPIPARQLFWPMIVGFFANNILPFRMGELVRAHITGTKFRISRTSSLGTILLERLCDTISFLTTFLLVAIFFPFPRFVEQGAALLGGACVATIAALWVIHKHEEKFRSTVDHLAIPEHWKHKIKDMVEKFAHGISGITQPRSVVGAIMLSMVIWTLEGTFLFVMARAFAVPLPYPQSFFLLFFLGLSVTLPQAPGYVGTMELFGVTALSLLGIPKEKGFPLVLAIHGTQFVFIMILGTIALWKEGLSFRTLASSTQNEPDRVPDL